MSYQLSMFKNSETVCKNPYRHSAAGEEFHIFLLTLQKLKKSKMYKLKETWKNIR
jgi:hypothetical protein